jgi:hypothetical protein
MSLARKARRLACWFARSVQVDTNSLRYGRLPILVLSGWQQILQPIDLMDDVAKVPNCGAQGVARSCDGVMCAGKGEAIPVPAYPADRFEVQVDRNQLVE